MTPIRSETELAWLESPGSPTFEAQDVPAICAAARERGVLTMIDGTGSPQYSSLVALCPCST